MPIRITGMNSGLDTESIITELVKAQKTKTENIKKKQVAHEWKQDAWKELNSKIYKLFNSTLNNMRLEADYSKKTTELSNSSVASVITGSTAMNALQELEVEELATTAYMTGGEITDASGNSNLVSELGIAENSVISVTAGGKTTDITVTSDMSVNGFVEKLKSAGVEASFDEKNRRIHIAGKESGADGSFTITSSDADALGKLGITAGETKGKNAKIILNGATYYSSTNSFEVNGLTITAMSKGTTTMTTRRDTEGVYNMIKNFLKEYNSLINEMDSLYNADAADGYEPLSDDEKEAMSDSEIEKWEDKIKDSILRRDSGLSTVSSAMKRIMLQGVEVEGEKLFLADFGVETLSYFISADNEKNAYHINGDEDDSAVSSQENKLKAAIASDPDKVISFFSKLSQNLYDELNEQSRSVPGVRSFGTFYDDQKMKEDYKNYTTKIQEQEDRLTALQDRWYDKFSAMETALARMQSNQSAVSSLLGGM